MALNDLFQAFQMFQQGSKDLAISNGVSAAADQVKMLAQDASLTANQKLMQQNQLATQLQAQMAAAGANPAQTQLAVGALTPPKVQDAQQAVYAAQTTDDPELKKQYLSLADQFAKTQAAPSIIAAQAQQPFTAEQNRLQLKNSMDIALLNADERLKAAQVAANKERALNPTAAKKIGLFQSGLVAEQQYNTAVNGGKKDYDPTSVGEFIDNSSWAPNFLKSNAAVQATTASDSWIDSFLRDESGAAIPDNERGSYRKIYFPSPGDDPVTVANKAALRKQKMANAGQSAGLRQEDLTNAFGATAKPVSPSGPLPTTAPQSAGQTNVQITIPPAGSAMAIVITPDGRSKVVPESQVDFYVSKGAKRK